VGQLTIPSALLQSTQGWLEILLSARSDRFTHFTVALTDGSSMPVIARYYPSEVIPVQIQ
jgi:hypothetical protein